MQQISSLSASRPDVDARGGLSGVESNCTPPAASGPELFPRSGIESKERFCIQLQTAGHVVGANAGLVPRKVQAGPPNAAPKILFPSTAVRASRVESQSDGTPPLTHKNNTPLSKVVRFATATAPRSKADVQPYCLDRCSRLS